MNIVTFTDLRKNLKDIMDKAVNDFEPVYVKRPNGTDVVVLDMNSYESLKETAYLLGNEVNAKHLRKSLSDIEQGHIIEKSLEDLGDV